MAFYSKARLALPAARPPFSHPSSLDLVVGPPLLIVQPYTSRSMSGSMSPRSSTSTYRGPDPVEEGLRREELRAEEYGGDDPHDPLPKDHGEIPIPPADKEDPNKVGWDGPDDPTNPQNWTQRRKWAITILCTLLTVNVYVFIPDT